MVVGGGGLGVSCKNEENLGSCPAKANSQVGKSGLLKVSTSYIYYTIQSKSNHLTPRCACAAQGNNYVAEDSHVSLYMYINDQISHTIRVNISYVTSPWTNKWHSDTWFRVQPNS